MEPYNKKQNNKRKTNIHLTYILHVHIKDTQKWILLKEVTQKCSLYSIFNSDQEILRDLTRQRKNLLIDTIDRKLWEDKHIEVCYVDSLVSFQSDKGQSCLWSTCIPARE